jgi:hypothetical protein
MTRANTQRSYVRLDLDLAKKLGMEVLNIDEHSVELSYPCERIDTEVLLETLTKADFTRIEIDTAISFIIEMQNIKVLKKILI